MPRPQPHPTPEAICPGAGDEENALSPAEIDFILEHGDDDTLRLLLSESKQENKSGLRPPLRLTLCIRCIEARRKIKNKVPEWYRCPELVYPQPLSVEQGSSQATALYKQHLVQQITNRPDGRRPVLADLTGGMGVDSYYLSRIAERFYYNECRPDLFRAAVHNFKILNAVNITSSCSTVSVDSPLPETLHGISADLIYLDPARRGAGNAKLVSMNEYQPNLLELKETLFQTAPRILVKISPMADIRQHLRWMPETRRIYILSAENECKELLFLLERPGTDASFPGDPEITAADLSGDGTAAASFTFRLSEEGKSRYTCPDTAAPGTYLYEPGKALLKSGAFRLTAERFRLQKLAPSTHLYVSDALPAEEMPFPGKIYRIEEILEFNKRMLKKLSARFPQADLSARNFPMTSDQLKKAAGIRDGGDRHLFAVTLADGSRKIIVSSRYNPLPHK